jgi:hypothetical protein
MAGRRLAPHARDPDDPLIAGGALHTDQPGNRGVDHALSTGKHCRGEGILPAHGRNIANCSPVTRCKCSR